MPLRESKTEEERMQLIEATSTDAANFLGVRFEKHSPKEIITRIDKAVVAMVFDEPTRIPSTEDSDILLGALWGSQIVKGLGWHWADIHFDQGMDVAVVSPKRDMIIYPFTFVSLCTSKQKICTIELSFNMLRERKDEMIYEENGYVDIMDHITHIVPPYELTRIS